MQDLTQEEIISFIEENIISEFYQRRLNNLKKLKIYDLLKAKNPYLFNAKNIVTAEELVTDLLLARMSSSEETLFGGFLEQLARFICERTYGGHKSSTKGLDLEFEKDSVVYIVAVKSGPDWANSSSHEAMLLAFRAAKKTLGTNDPKSKKVIAVNGCCYGVGNFDRGEYLKICGQEFWTLISGDNEMYAKILVPLNEETKENDKKWKEALAAKITQLTEDFKNEFWTNEQIDWAKFAKLTSGIREPKKARSNGKPKRTQGTTRSRRPKSNEQ